MGLQTQGLVVLNTQTIAKAWWIGVGTGTGDFEDGRTTMYSELVRVPASAAYASANEIRLEGYLTQAQGVGTLSEIAVFDAASGGNLILHEALDPADIKPANEGRTLIVRLPVSKV